MKNRGESDLGEGGVPTTPPPFFLSPLSWWVMIGKQEAEMKCNKEKDTVTGKFNCRHFLTKTPSILHIFFF